MKKDKDKRESGQVSRRDFLIGAGSVIVGGAIGAGITYPLVPREAAETVTTTAPGPTETVATTAEGETVTTTVTKTIEVPGPTITKTVEVPGPTVTETVEVPAELPKLTVNGKTYELKLEPEWTLRYVLHDKLGLTGVKAMCSERGQCGSCTVIMDGRPILSCMALAMECEGHEIETVEGIAAAKHPIVQSFVNFDGMQCGYCTPGAVVTAKALMDKNPDPTEEEVWQALSGNLCICGAYPAWPKAVAEAIEKIKEGK